jgi:hypothetical protein
VAPIPTAIRFLRPKRSRRDALRDWVGGPGFPRFAIVMELIAIGRPDAAPFQSAKPLRLREADRGENDGAALADLAQLVLDVEGGHDNLEDGEGGLTGCEGQSATNAPRPCRLPSGFRHLAHAGRDCDTRRHRCP